jgi:radical SAM modification target selenobiotic family peptide
MLYHFNINNRRFQMDSEKLKKMLAGISITALIAGATVTTGCGKSG